MDATANLPHAHGAPVVRGTIKLTPEDFVVDEVLSFEPSGSGEHAFVQIEKWGENTDFVARELARFTGTKSRDVGFAGLKDRHGRTTQWFSIQLPGKDDPDWTTCRGEQFQIIANTRNDRKLRRGAIKENRFSVTLRDLDHPADQLDDRLNAIKSLGVPNYFGPQRFGRDGRNVEHALILMRQPDTRINSHLRGIYLSAARSELFNQILAERVRAGTWNQGIAGDVYMFPDSKSHFEAEAGDEEIKRRVRELEIHPSGPLIGEKPSLASRSAADLEAAVLSRHQELSEGLVAARLESLRRPYRLAPSGLISEVLADGSLRLKFSLPAGTYATTVLRELIRWDAGEQPEV